MEPTTCRRRSGCGGIGAISRQAAAEARISAREAEVLALVGEATEGIRAARMRRS